ncbi:VOC family protein [Flavobacterium piscis]|uniref:VOC family protein n=1 Tax=Flavobacterium piscis TaxID=1114874 RepID=UPI001A9D3E1E|nr:VOC family protein [Flavobacterium piscis]MCA1920439.1 VOC family protein [Flavobacterium piscis]
MSIINNYDNFFLPVDNIDQAKEFYTKKLGLGIKFDFPDKGMTAFKVGSNEPAIIVTTIKNAKPAIWFTVDNVQDAYEDLKQKGVEFLSEPFEIKTGLSVEFKDPFGNKLGLTDYSKMPKSTI